MRGIPVRIELGPKDIAAGKCVAVRRDTREKIEIALDELEAKLPELLEQIQKDMLRVQKHTEMHISGMHIITKNLPRLQMRNRALSVQCGVGIRLARTRSKKTLQ